MVAFFNVILFQPIYNLLIFFYNAIPGHDIGFAIIALTVIIKLVLLPLSWQSTKSQAALQTLQPKINAIKEQYKNDKEKLAQETMKLYREQKVNPFSSCLPILIQLPILIAVYQAFRVGLTHNNFELLYPFVANPGQINNIAFGFLNMSVPNTALAILTGLAQFWQTKMLPISKPAIAGSGAKDEAMLASMNKSMLYFMPLMTVVIGMSLPAGLTFYWLLTTALTILQQKFMFKKKAALATVN